MCVFVVEDDALIRAILMEELLDRGFDTQGASTGDEASSMYDDLQPPISVLVTDIHMPGDIDGIALAELVRIALPEIPVIFTTGRPDAFLQQRTLGVKQYLIRKPYRPADVINCIDALANC